MAATLAGKLSAGVVEAGGFVRRLPSAARRRYSPSSLLFVSVAALGILLVFSSVVAIHYFGKDPVTSLSYIPEDGFCRTDLHEGVGVHCFSDYQFVVPFTSQPNPWDRYEGYLMNYPASGMLPHAFFGVVGRQTGEPNAGLFGYLGLLIAALLVPAFWASRGKSASIRVATLGLFGLLSAPSIMALDRGNSIALVVPAVLAFLVALRRGNDRWAVIAIVLAALVKPQYALLFLVLVAMRKWRRAGMAIAGVIVTNVLAFLVWPRDFPGEIVQAGYNVLRSGSTVPLSDAFPSNVSLSKGLHVVEKVVRHLTGTTDGAYMVDAHALVAGAVTATVICGLILIAGTRIPAYLSGILVVMCVSLVPSTSWSYYLVFALPVAAILLRDPLGAPVRDRWNGVLDKAGGSVGRVVASVMIVVATAATVSRVLLPVVAVVPGSPRTDILLTSGDLVPVLWILTALVVLVAWWRPEPATQRATASNDGDA